MLVQNSYLIKKFSSLEFKKNPYELSGTIYNVHEELLEIVNNKKTIALISPWIRSFAEIDIDEVYHALYLPPFEDMTGETRTFLNSLDVIIIDNEWNNKQPSIATQSYLRYKLHIQPFIEDAKQNGWQEKEIKGFGKVYIKN